MWQRPFWVEWTSVDHIQPENPQKVQKFFCLRCCQVFDVVKLDQIARHRGWCLSKYIPTLIYKTILHNPSQCFSILTILVLFWFCLISFVFFYVILSTFWDLRRFDGSFVLKDLKMYILHNGLSILLLQSAPKVTSPPREAVKEQSPGI